MDGFDRKYLKDHENSAWVHEMMAKKGFEVDRRKLIMRLPKRSIDILFAAMIRREFSV